MATPYTWRTFTIDAPMAREGQSDRFFLQKRHYIYKLWVKKQKQDKKLAKKLKKKNSFSSSSGCLYGFGLKCCATFQAKPIRTAGGAGKSRFFGGFLPVFCPVVCIFPICIHIIRIFKKKSGLASFFWPHGPLIQKSAAPQGLPPPTQK